MNPSISTIPSLVIPTGLIADQILAAGSVQSPSLPPPPSPSDPRLAVAQGSIRTKAQFYELSHRQLLGNTIQQWEIADWQKSGYAKPVAIRHKVPGSPLMRYDLTPEQAAAYIQELIYERNIPETQLQVSEMAPDHLITLQGEVMRTDDRGLYLMSHLYSGTRMRYALAGGYIDKNGKLRYNRSRVKHHFGLQATMLIKRYMDAQSWDFLNEIFDWYPNDVTEFACYSRKVGVLNWNTVFWETRGF